MDEKVEAAQKRAEALGSQDARVVESDDNGFVVRGSD